VNETVWLDVADFRDELAWRWVLRDTQELVLAEHEANLDRNAPEYQGFEDLYRYLRLRVTPDRRLTDEAELVERIGRWVGEKVFGRVGATIATLAASAPVTVRVRIPRSAQALMYRPLELAYVGDRPVARHDASLVFQYEGRATGKDPIVDRLRMLAVFSLPTDSNALALHRERRELIGLVRAIAHRTSAAIQLMALQYGVTRASLRDLLQADGGWDVVHFSGHGLAGGLVLEDDDGNHDVIAAPQLAELLAGTRTRVKLVTLSSCESAALAVAESRELIGLSPPDDTNVLSGYEQDTQATRLPALASELADRLDCGVLAMRFPVGDEFARALTGNLYGRFLGEAVPLPRALQLSLAAVVAPAPSPGCPALSVVTPALFGGRAADLRLELPKGESVGLGPTERMRSFPKEPGHFVGRIGPMSRAVKALAPTSGQRGVLFHGMAGAGKTACALELAYGHEHVFEVLVWYRAPEEGRDVGAELGKFVHILETKLPWLHLRHLLDDQDRFHEARLRLKAALERHKVLVVLDNVESLLDKDGMWQDQRWSSAVGALVGHDGESRVVLTARRRPSVLDPRIRVEAIHAFRLDEAVLLARELPGLRALLEGGTALPLDTGRRLVARTLEIVQGHPKLLDFADRQAGDPASLERHLADADRAWAAGGTRLDAFVRDGDTSASTADFLRILAGWTNGITAILPDESAMLFHLLCAMEEIDRRELIVRGAWDEVRRRLENSDVTPGVEGMAATLFWHIEDLPDIEGALQALLDSGLVGIDGQLDGWASYVVHPAVAAAGRAAAGEHMRTVVDGVMGDLWFAQFAAAINDQAGEATGRIVRTCLCAAPYLLRAGRWRLASTVMEQALARDDSPQTAATLLPLIRHLAEATKGSDRELVERGLVAWALATLHSDSAETSYRELVEEAVAQGQYRSAALFTGQLAERALAAGRVDEALRLFSQLRDYLQRSGAKPWTLLRVDVRELSAWRLQGRDEEILERVRALRRPLADLPEEWQQQEEYVLAWQVREEALELGRWAAISLRQMQDALLLSTELIESMIRRSAPPRDIAEAQFMHHVPLRALGRSGEARAVLLECREVFADEEHFLGLGGVFNALGVIEAELGHYADALRFGQDALRMHYLVMDVDAIAGDHHNLAGFLRAAGGQPADQIAHRLAACVIRLLTGEGQLLVSLHELARDTGAVGDAPPVPSSFADLIDRLNRVEGVRFEELFHRVDDVRTGDTVVAEVLRRAAELSSDEVLGIERHITTWEPLLVGLVMASRGDWNAALAVGQLLNPDQHHRDWAGLIGVFRRMLGGERGDQLLSGLDRIDATIVRRGLDALAGRIELPRSASEQWAAQMLVFEALPMTALLAAARMGDQQAGNMLAGVLEQWSRQGGDRAKVAAAVRRVSLGEPGNAVMAELDPQTRTVVSVLLTDLEFRR
jgi:tetratricopeptide (TPR) repeat protein